MENENYKDVEIFVDTYVKHGIEGLAAFHGILEYAQFVDNIDYNEAKQLLYDFVGKMLLPEDYE
jgi:hypothetical protein